MKKIPTIFFFFLYFFFSCKKEAALPPIDDNIDLDGKIIFDPSLSKPADYLISKGNKNPDSLELIKPVVIAVHGFSASTFEWTEFRDWAKTNNYFNVSLVLLGGHGRDYESFRKSTWKDWQQPIIDEYNALRSMGYKKISIIASSTGCPLVLDMISSGKIASDVLKHIFFIDPIIVPSNKTLSLVPVLGSFISYSPSDMEAGENGYWYKYRPQEALKQLEKLIEKERKDLEKGISFPEGIMLTVYKSEKDASADPVSAAIIHKGMKSAVEIVMVNSDLHVFTRLDGRNNFSSDDFALQLKTFEQIQAGL